MRAGAWIVGLILATESFASGCGSRTSTLLDTGSADAGTGSGSGGGGSSNGSGSTSSSGSGSGSSSGSDAGTDSGACGAGESPCAGACCGGTCTSGRCLVTLATWHEIDEIAVDARAVYWTDVVDGTVLSVPLGGGAVTTLASGQDASGRIAVNGSSLYWTGTSSITKLPLGGGSAPVTLASGQGGTSGLAVDATNVYWLAVDASGMGSVLRTPTSGGPVTTLVSGVSQPHEIAVDAANVYWTMGVFGVDSMVMSAPIGGGSAVTVAQAGPYPPYDLAALPLPVMPGQVAQNVYWTAGKGQVGLFAAPATGGAEVTLATGAGTRVAVDATTVYWAGGAVMSVPAVGGTPVSLAPLPGGGGTAVAVDATSVYWVEYAPSSTSLMKLTPK